MYEAVLYAIKKSVIFCLFDRVENQAGERDGAIKRHPSRFTASGNADRTRVLAVLPTNNLRCRIFCGGAGVRCRKSRKHPNNAEFKGFVLGSVGGAVAKSKGASE